MIPEPLKIRLSIRERETILSRVSLPTNIAARLRFALHTRDGIEITMTRDDSFEFGEALHQSLPGFKKREEAELVVEVLRRLSSLLGGSVSEAGQAGLEEDDLEFPPDMPEAVREALRALVKEHEFTSPEEMLGAFRHALIHADDSPRDHLLGLTAAETLRLVQSEWTETNSAVVLNEDLTWEALSGSRYCMDAFRFLELAAASGGFKLTPRKQLNRASVKSLIDEGIYPGPDWEFMSSRMKVVNEIDVFPLHMVHQLLLDCRLVRHFKGKLVITKLGLQMLKERNAGAVQCAMFHALFQGMDLAYLDRLPDYSGLQATFGFILYAFGQVAHEPIASEALMEIALMPGVTEQFEALPYPRHRAIAFVTRVLNPLRDFGLVEITRSGEGYQRNLEMDQVQVTPLFDAMLQFNVTAE